MTEINYWLMKSEPDAYSIDQLKKDSSTLWDGIRNYQARNFMRKMKPKDKAFFYHSNCITPGIVGLMEVIETDQIDPTQFDSNSKYFDPKSSKDIPRWDCVKVSYLGHFNKGISLKELKDLYTSEDMQILRKGNRLSIIPVDKKTALNLLEKLGDLK